MQGKGRAHAAITILNGTATGVGCSLAVEGGVEANWEWGATPSFQAEPACDDAVAKAVLAQLPERPGEARIATRSTFPARRGLKTSSSSAAALLQAAHRSLGHELDAAATLRLAVDACRAAGVTLTGAFDDQAAVVRGGCHLADNALGLVRKSFEVPPWHVAVWVPDASIPKSAVAALDLSEAKPVAGHLAETLTVEEIPEAMTTNGHLFATLYRLAGLPVDEKPADVAFAYGALGAGLSGTGPAVAALFDDPVELPPVRGGRWHWTRAVPERRGPA